MHKGQLSELLTTLTPVGKCFRAGTFHFHVAFCGLSLVRFDLLPSLLKLNFESRIRLMSVDGTDMIESHISLYFLNSKGLVFDIPFPFNIYV